MENMLSRRDFMRAFGAGVATLASARVMPRLGFAPNGAAGKDRRNILFLFADDQRFNTIHALGNEVISTRNLDSLVENGLTFTHTFSSIPICTPSRAELPCNRIGQFRPHGPDSTGKADSQREVLSGRRCRDSLSGPCVRRSRGDHIAGVRARSSHGVGGNGPLRSRRRLHPRGSVESLVVSGDFAEDPANALIPLGKVFLNVGVEKTSVAIWSGRGTLRSLLSSLEMGVKGGACYGPCGLRCWSALRRFSGREGATMTVQAEISLYLFGEADLSPAIEDFVGVLREEGLDPQTGAMSTVVAGDSRIVFSAIAKAFERVAATHQCVVIAKYSNACAPINQK